MNSLAALHWLLKCRAVTAMLRVVFFFLNQHFQIPPKANPSPILSQETLSSSDTMHSLGEGRCVHTISYYSGIKYCIYLIQSRAVYYISNVYY